MRSTVVNGNCSSALPLAVNNIFHKVANLHMTLDCKQTCLYGTFLPHWHT